MHLSSVSITPLSVPQMVYRGSRSSSSRLIVANPSVGLTDRDMLASTKNPQPRYGAIAHGVGALGSLANRSNPDTRNLTLATTRHAVVEILGSMCSPSRLASANR